MDNVEDFEPWYNSSGNPARFTEPSRERTMCLQKAVERISGSKDDIGSESTEEVVLSIFSLMQYFLFSNFHMCDYKCLILALSAHALDQTYFKLTKVFKSQTIQNFSSVDVHYLITLNK